MKRVINTTATAHIGYIEKLPYRRPSPEIESRVVELVEEIVALLKEDAQSDISVQRYAIDELIFDLFEIKASRDLVREFYDSLGTRSPSESAGKAVDGDVAEAVEVEVT